MGASNSSHPDPRSVHLGGSGRAATRDHRPFPRPPLNAPLRASSGRPLWPDSPPRPRGRGHASNAWGQRIHACIHTGLTGVCPCRTARRTVGRHLPLTWPLGWRQRRRPAGARAQAPRPSIAPASVVGSRSPPRGPGVVRRARCCCRPPGEVRRARGGVAALSSARPFAPSPPLSVPGCVNHISLYPLYPVR